MLLQGSARRKKKVIHRTNTTDDKKLQGSLKKLGLTTIPGIEEVNNGITVNLSIYLWFLILFDLV